jgi:energy-coupling factor transporter transmembrane protein EcfT
VLFAGGLLVAFGAGNLFFAVTRVSDIKRAASRLNRPFGLALSLMLSFIPLFFEVWDERCDAWKARGNDMGVRALCCIVPSTLEKLMERAVERATALEARGALW